MFDSCALQSFVSASLVEKLHLNTSLVMDPIVASNPVGGLAHLSMVCQVLRVSILSVGFECNALIPGFTGYGLILLMD